MKSITDYIKSDPQALTIEDVNALIDAFPDQVAVYAKHLIDGEKLFVYYESAKEATQDQERYGSIWITVDGQQGFMRMKEYEITNSSIQ